MPRAYLLIRQHPILRQDAFLSGLNAAGFKVALGVPARAEKGDVLVLWNGHFGADEIAARRFEAQGGRLLVAENSYVLPEGGEKWQHFALAEHGHNGSGWTPWGGPERWTSFGIELKPWRTEGRHIVLFCQRGIGAKQMASPKDWEAATVAQLRRYTDRPVVVLRHPGKPAVHPVAVQRAREALAGAHACVIWSSSNGVRALMEGVPVIYTAPHWICSGAAGHDLSQIESPPMPERLPVFQRLAWAQFSAYEIASGFAFRQFAEMRAAA